MQDLLVCLARVTCAGEYGLAATKQAVELVRETETYKRLDPNLQHYFAGFVTAFFHVAEAHGE